MANTTEEKESHSPVNVKNVDYKDIEVLKHFVNANGRILSRRISGLSAHNQRRIAMAIKRARFMGLLPFVQK